MNRKHIRAYLFDSKKKKIITMRIFVIIALLICAFSFTYIYYLKNKKVYIKYTEDGSLDYKVYLKENDFFEGEFVESNKEYVTNLINYINTDFKYNLKMQEENANYNFAYSVEAVVDVYRKDNNNSMYNFSEYIVPAEVKSTSEREITINRFEKIDYNKYNELAKSFISLYNLDNAAATLTINFYVNVTGNSDTFASNVNNENVYSLCMPLNQNTINAEVKTMVKNDEDKVIECKKKNSKLYCLCLVIAIGLIFVSIYKAYKLIKYIHKNRTAESIYERQLRKILNNYGSYIQKVNSGFDAKGNSVLEVDTFNDLLEIRETIQEPIIMLENKEKTETYFMIVGRMNIIYVYYIKVSDIKRKKSKKTDLVEI